MLAIYYIFFGSVIFALIVVIILLIVFHRSDSRDLRDRLMAKDYHDLSVGKRIQKVKPKTDVEEAEAAIGGITRADREQADRLPVT